MQWIVKLATEQSTLNNKDPFYIDQLIEAYITLIFVLILLVRAIISLRVIYINAMATGRLFSSESDDQTRATRIR